MEGRITHNMDRSTNQTRVTAPSTSWTIGSQQQSKNKATRPVMIREAVPLTTCIAAPLKID